MKKLHGRCKYHLSRISLIYEIETQCVYLAVEEWKNFAERENGTRCWCREDKTQLVFHKRANNSRTTYIYIYIFFYIFHKSYNIQKLNQFWIFLIFFLKQKFKKSEIWKNITIFAIFKKFLQNNINNDENINNKQINNNEKEIIFSMFKTLKFDNVN